MKERSDGIGFLGVLGEDRRATWGGGAADGGVLWGHQPRSPGERDPPCRCAWPQLLPPAWGGAGLLQCSCNCVAPPGVRVRLSSATARNARKPRVPLSSATARNPRGKRFLFPKTQHASAHQPRSPGGRGGFATMLVQLRRPARGQGATFVGNRTKPRAQRKNIEHASGRQPCSPGEEPKVKPISQRDSVALTTKAALKRCCHGRSQLRACS